MKTDELDELGALVAAIGGVARAIRDLGNADASTPMGGLEAHGLAVKEAGDAIREGLQALADAIREGRDSA